MAGAAIFGCRGPRLTPDERRFFAEAQPWGFILFARNIETPDQVRRLTAGLRAAVGRDAPVLIDQEGGRVQRMGPPHWREWLPPLDQMRAASDPERAMRLRYRLIADELRGIGIDSNCAPCCDIARHDTHPVLRNRCYGTDAAGVARIARVVADGLLAGGVLPVMKHIPGHGRALVDSHLSLPRVSEPAETLRETDFAPFRALADLPMAMSAHVVFEALDAARPATTSKRVIGTIRGEIGFGGLLMTDDISMQALDGALGARAAAALAAGCDLVLHCSGDMDAMQAVAAAAGALSGAPLARAEAALAARRDPDPIDIAAAEAEFSGLLNGKVHG